MGISAYDVSNLSSHCALSGCFEKRLRFEFMQMENGQGKDVCLLLIRV